MVLKGCLICCLHGRQCAAAKAIASERRRRPPVRRRHRPETESDERKEFAQVMKYVEESPRNSSMNRTITSADLVKKQTTGKNAERKIRETDEDEIEDRLPTSTKKHVRKSKSLYHDIKGQPFRTSAKPLLKEYRLRTKLTVIFQDLSSVIGSQLYAKHKLQHSHSFTELKYKPLNALAQSRSDISSSSEETSDQDDGSPQYSEMILGESSPSNPKSTCPLKRYYIGVVSRKTSEMFVWRNTAFRVYHEISEHDSSNSEYPLYIVYKNSRGKYL
ncbi:unnamed protein product [Anisakis simplex]|uniref:Tudor domain-containing protein n=1 Tax=Anisakis simplex TaxID=6269 RepID=A0A0M3KDX3_ANISI|nr:unnamed protein product [Anisakis simplex]